MLYNLFIVPKHKFTTRKVTPDLVLKPPKSETDGQRTLVEYGTSRCYQIVFANVASLLMSGQLYDHLVLRSLRLPHLKATVIPFLNENRNIIAWALMFAIHSTFLFWR